MYTYPSPIHVHFSSLLELPDITQFLKESKMHSTRYQIDYHIFFLNVVQITTLVNISLSLKLPKSGKVFAVSSLILNEIMIHMYVKLFSGANDEVKLAKRRLQMLSNHVFEELAMDVYDEVDRRETDSIWNNVHMKVLAIVISNEMDFFLKSKH